MMAIQQWRPWVFVLAAAIGHSAYGGEFEFDVWGSPPSRGVYELSGEPLVQRILCSIEEQAASADRIATVLEAPTGLVTQKLQALAKCGLVTEDDGRWLSHVPMYSGDEIRAAEALGVEYARKQADVLRKELPALKAVFARTTVAKHFSWDQMSLIVVGGLLSDLCVVDRIPFTAEHHVEELQPSLVTPSGKRWRYDGFEKLSPRYRSRRYTFYHNQFSKCSGGLARFGFTAEQRASQPSQPEGWMRFEQGRILFALVEGPLSAEELKQRTSLKDEILTVGLDALAKTTPPAILLENDRYRSKVPVLTRSDLILLLTECDRIATIVFEQVTLAHARARRAQGKAMGSRWPLPDDFYVRDKAIELLSASGDIVGPAEPPVAWNSGFWGWKGFLAIHDDVTDGVTGDRFLETDVSVREAAEIQRLNARKAAIFAGQPIVDISTPTHAWLTLISAYEHSDVTALKDVEPVPGRDYAGHLQNLRNQGWLGFIGKVDIRRVPAAVSDPTDGTLQAVFTMHERGFEEAYVFFYYRGGWRYLGSTYKDGRWRLWAEGAVEDRIEQLTAAGTDM